MHSTPGGKHTMWEGRSQAQRSAFCVILFIAQLEKVKLYREKTVSVGGNGSHKTKCGWGRGLVGTQRQTVRAPGSELRPHPHVRATRMWV